MYGLCSAYFIRVLLTSNTPLFIPQYGMLQVSEDGLRITVEQGKSIQATLFMPPGAFKEFFVQDFQSFGLKMKYY